MAFMWKILLPLVFCVYLCQAETLLVGSTTNASLIHMETVTRSGIPLKKRTKTIFYNGETANARPIKAVWAQDLDNSAAKASITAGGVGFTYVNVKLKSASGDGLNYRVQIFV